MAFVRANAIFGFIRLIENEKGYLLGKIAATLIRFLNVIFSDVFRDHIKKLAGSETG